MAVTRQGFAFFEQLFDYPYPFAKYDQLFVPEFNAGAMENAGAVTFLEDYVFRSNVPDAVVERRAETILHELAHMWFGDLVTMRWWDDLWLNESFADYVSVLCQAEATRWPQAWTTFANVEKTWAYRQDQLPSTHPIAADIRDLEDVEVNFDGITYAKGASVLKQLVAWVGRDAFFEGIRRYFHSLPVGQHDACRPARQAGARRPAATSRPGPRNGWKPRGSTRCGRRSSSTQTAGSRLCGLAGGAGEASDVAVAPAWRSGCTTARPPVWSAATASSSTSPAPAPRWAPPRDRGRRTSCCSMTTTSPTARSGSTPGRSAPC